MMSRGLWSVSAISVRSLPAVRNDCPQLWHLSRARGALFWKGYFKNCLFHVRVESVIVRHKLGRYPIRGTATRLIKVVAHELILHYTLNTVRHLQLFITSYYQRDARHKCSTLFVGTSLSGKPAGLPSNLSIRISMSWICRFSTDM
jgi:hypothetical protein